MNAGLKLSLRREEGEKALEEDKEGNAVTVMVEHRLCTVRTYWGSYAGYLWHPGRWLGAKGWGCESSLQHEAERHCLWSGSKDHCVRIHYTTQTFQMAFFFFFPSGPLVNPNHIVTWPGKTPASWRWCMTNSIEPLMKIMSILSGSYTNILSQNTIINLSQGVRTLINRPPWLSPVPVPFRKLCGPAVHLA